MEKRSTPKDVARPAVPSTTERSLREFSSPQRAFLLRCRPKLPVKAEKTSRILKKTPRYLEHIPKVRTFASQLRTRALSSAGSERLPYKQRVGGSNPSAPTYQEATQKSRFFFLSLPGLTPNYAVACAMHVNEREWYANFSACLISFRLKRLHNVAGEWESANAPTGILTACRRNKKGYAPRKSVALYAVEKEQSADEPGSVLCVAKCSSFIWMRRCRHILSFYPPTLLRGAIGRAALRRRFT